MREATEERKREAALHAEALLDQAFTTMTGWVLQFDNHEVMAAMEPLYRKLEEVVGK